MIILIYKGGTKLLFEILPGWAFFLTLSALSIFRIRLTYQWKKIRNNKNFKELFEASFNFLLKKLWKSLSTSSPTENLFMSLSLQKAKKNL